MAEDCKAQETGMIEEEWNNSTNIGKMFNFAKPTKRKCLLFVVAYKNYICKQLNLSKSDAHIENDLIEAESVNHISDSGRLIDEERVRKYTILYAIEFSERTIQFLAEETGEIKLVTSLKPLQWQANLLRHMVRPFKE